MSTVSVGGRARGVCYYVGSSDPALREAFGELPPSIQAIVKRYASEEVLSAEQLRHLARVPATDRCEALQMLYMGSPVAEVVYFLLLSSVPSSTRTSTHTVPAKADDIPTAADAKITAEAEARGCFPAVEKENNTTTRDAVAKTRSSGTTEGPSLRTRTTPNATASMTVTVKSIGAQTSRVPDAANAGARGESVSTFITVSPISSEEDEDGASVQDGSHHRTATIGVSAAGAGTSPRSENSPGAINRSLSYGSVSLPATVSSRHRPARGAHPPQPSSPPQLVDEGCTSRTVTAPVPSVSPAPVVIPNSALGKVIAAAANARAAAPVTAAAPEEAQKATERGASPSLRPPPNSTPIITYVDVKPATTTTEATSAEAIDLGSDPRAQALLDLYRRNVLKNEMELEQAYTELSYNRSSVSPCAPPPGGMDWKTFLSHVRQKMRLAEKPSHQPHTATAAYVAPQAQRTSAVYTVKRSSGGGRSGTAAGAVALGSPRDPAVLCRSSRGTEKTLTPHGTPRGTPRGCAAAVTGAASPPAGVATPNASSSSMGSPRFGLRATESPLHSQRSRPHPRNDSRRAGRRATPGTGVPLPQKPCAAWDPVRGMYITHPHQLDADPFESARAAAGTRAGGRYVDPAPRLQPLARTKSGNRHTRHAFGRSQTAVVAAVPVALHRQNTRTGPSSARGRPMDCGTSPLQKSQRAAAATAAFTRTLSAPCGFTRTASTAAPFARLRSSAFYDDHRASPRSRAVPTHAAAPVSQQERLQRTPSRWERPLESTPAASKEVTAGRPVGRIASARTRTRTASAAAATSGVVKRRPATPRGEPKATHPTRSAATGVFERLTSNYYPCSTPNSKNNYAWRSGFSTTAADAVANIAAHHSTQSKPLQRTASKSALSTVAEPTPELCSPRPTSRHNTQVRSSHTDSRQSHRTATSASARTAGRGTTAAMVSPISTPRSASYRKSAPIIEVHKSRVSAFTAPRRTAPGADGASTAAQ